MRAFVAACSLYMLVFPLAPGEAFAQSNAIPVITIFPDDTPLDAAFFFPSGSPLERFTGRPGAWYALYRVALSPGYPYEVILGHRGDPGRIKVFALDNHPFAPVSVKIELHFSKVEWWHHSDHEFYTAKVSLPRNAAVDSIYLLVEWNPPIGKDRPIPLHIQILSIDPSYEVEQRPSRGGYGVKSPLQSQKPTIYEVPVPRVYSDERAPGDPINRHPEWR